MGAPKIENCSAICIANSRLAVSTKAYTPNGSFESVYKIGNANAAVLPDPVGEETESGTRYKKGKAN